jgi:hypothetical protein
MLINVAALAFLIAGLAIVDVGIFSLNITAASAL